ncbi:hypothetical protein LXL04_006917 [Taraxacum kok-saghyz]
MLYYGNDSNLTRCRVCGHDRYKSDRLSLVSCLVMRYLPIAPRLERLYATKNTAKQMTWHFDHRTEPGFMSHPRDGQAWKHFDSMHPEFACDPRNIRLGLCTDGFSPNNSNSSPYSCWPESKLQRPPTRLELFDKTHRSKKPKESTSNSEYVTPKNPIIVESYMVGMKAKYGADVDSHPPYDHDLWLEVTGGHKKGRVLGFGCVSDPHEFMVPSQAAPSTAADSIDVIVNRVPEEMKDEIRMEREEIATQKEEITKMYNVICEHAQGNSLPN